MLKVSCQLCLSSPRLCLPIPRVLNPTRLVCATWEQCLSCQDTFLRHGLPLGSCKQYESSGVFHSLWERQVMPGLGLINSYLQFLHFQSNCLYFCVCSEMLCRTSEEENPAEMRYPITKTAFINLVTVFYQLVTCDSWNSHLFISYVNPNKMSKMFPTSKLTPRRRNSHINNSFEFSSALLSPQKK